MTAALRTDPKPVATVAPATGAENAVTMVVATWLMLGLFIDGWAHNTRPGLETFFTPWHAVFYSGFAACAAWTAVIVNRRAAGHPWRRSVLPPGYGLAAVGIGVFAVGGLGDLIWHTVFGIETSVDALFSPTHLLLFAGIMALVTTPVRAVRHRGWTAGGRAIDVTQVSVTLATGLVLFFLQYLSMFDNSFQGMSRVRGRVFLAPAITDEGLRENFLETHLLFGIVALLVSALVVTAPLLWLARERGLRPGAVLFHIGLLALFLNGIQGFNERALIGAGLLAGIVGEAAVAALRPTPDRVAQRHVLAVVLPTALLAAHTLVVALTEGVGWEAEFWTGTIVWAGIGGLGLSVLAEGRSRTVTS